MGSVGSNLTLKQKAEKAFNNASLKSFQHITDPQILNYFMYHLDDEFSGSELNMLLQKLKLNQKPIVLDDAEFDKQAKGKQLIYRGETPNQNSTADELVNELKYGEKTFASHGTTYGDGIYFTTDKSSAEGYSKKTTKPAVSTAFLNNKAKVIDFKALEKLAAGPSEFKSDPMRAKFSNISSYALYKGYNTIKVDLSGGETYYIPLVRDVLTIRKTTKKGN